MYQAKWMNSFPSMQQLNSFTQVKRSAQLRIGTTYPYEYHLQTIRRSETREVVIESSHETI